MVLCDVAETLRQMLDAMRDGDAATVRARALDLLTDAAPDAAVKSAAARALLFCGSPADALLYLSPDEHALRAKAHAYVGDFDSAHRELKLARAPADPEAEHSAAEIGRLYNHRGGRGGAYVAERHMSRYWARRDAAHEHLRSGDWKQFL